jgi:hypothetical protein
MNFVTGLTMKAVNRAMVSITAVKDNVTIRHQGAKKACGFQVRGAWSVIHMRFHRLLLLDTD